MAEESGASYQPFDKPVKVIQPLVSDPSLDPKPKREKRIKPEKAALNAPETVKAPSPVRVRGRGERKPAPHQPEPILGRPRVRPWQIAAALVLLLVVLAGAGYAIHRGGTSGSTTGASTAPTAAATTPVAPTTPAAGASGGPSPTATGTAPADQEAAQQALVATALDGTTFPAELNPPITALATAGPSEWASCLTVTAANVATCRFGPASAVHHAVLIGDATAIGWLPGLRKALPIDWDIRALTYPLCPVAAVSKDASCSAHRAFVVQQLQALHPDIVLMSDDYAFLDRIGGDLAVKTGDLKTALATAMPQLTALTKHLLVLGSPPGSGDLTTCAGATDPVHTCAKPTGDAWAAWTGAEKEAAAAAGGTYIDTVSWFCTTQTCPAVIGTTPVYTDGEHLTAAFSEGLGPVLRQKLGSLV